jgi:hypothetical protein
MDGWGFRQTYTSFGLAGTATTYVVDTRTNAGAAPWQALLDARLRGAHATIDLQSLGPGTTPPIASATVVRVGVTVYWTENGRVRSARLATVRM